jgi:hypothetical protein
MGAQISWWPTGGTSRGRRCASSSAFYLIIEDGVGAFWSTSQAHRAHHEAHVPSLYISRSLQTMGELLNAGVPMLDTLAITGDISGNQLLQEDVARVYAAVKQGKKISRSSLTVDAAAQGRGADDRRRRGVR